MNKRILIALLATTFLGAHAAHAASFQMRIWSKGLVAGTPSTEVPPVETPPSETPPAETPPAETPPVVTPPAAPSLELWASSTRLGSNPFHHNANFSNGTVWMGAGDASLYALNLGTDVRSTVPLSADWSAYGLTAAGFSALGVFPHPSDASLKVVVGDWSSGSPNWTARVAVFYVATNGQVTSGYVTSTQSSTPYATLRGTTMAIRWTNGTAGSMVCTLGASAPTCSPAYPSAQGTLPAIAPNGISYMASGSTLREYAAGPSAAPTSYTVTGLPASINKIAFGSDGNLYAAAVGIPAVWKIDLSTKAATLFAGSPTEAGNTGGNVETARFGTNLILQADPAGLLIKDLQNKKIYNVRL